MTAEGDSSIATGNAGKTIDRLLKIVARLRSDRGCPWDREQTLDSFKQYLVEETYELLDAIESGDPSRHAEELGDVLLQVAFQAQICKEMGLFDFEDVVGRLNDKLMRRHPHVFGSVTAETPEEVLRNWEAIKRGETGRSDASVLSGMPRHLPALHRAQRVQSGAARVGFDWKRVEDVLAKVEEELEEIRSAIAEGSAGRKKDEVGDLLFAAVNLARFLGVNSEEALAESVSRFMERFRRMEERAAGRGRKLEDCAPEEMDSLWEEAKEEEGR